MNKLMSLLMVIYISVFHPLIFDHTFYISIDLKFDYGGLNKEQNSTDTNPTFSSTAPIVPC